MAMTIAMQYKQQFPKVYALCNQRLGDESSRASGACSNVHSIAVAASALARAAIHHQQSATSAAAAAQAFAGPAVREEQIATSTARPASSHVLGDYAERREGLRA